MTAPSRTQDQFQLRLPEGLRGKIRDAAAINKRSMNAEIVLHLERAYDRTPPVVYDDVRMAMLEEIRATFGVTATEQMKERFAQS